MKYEEIKVNISNDSISDYKIFEGMKLYSEITKSKDGKKLTNKRVFVTKKHNYVYYERTDVNWNYWSDKSKYDSSFDSNDIKHNIVFEVSTELKGFTKYLGEEIIKKIMLKEENGEILIEASEGTMSVVPSVSQNLSLQPQSQDGISFVEKTIGTILNLHEKVLDAKDETLETLRNENKFLKEALISMQELYDEDRRTVETLTSQLKNSQEEVEFLKRKYKLMWNKAVENFKDDKE